MSTHDGSAAAGWSADDEIAALPRDGRHAACPLDAAFFDGADGPRCATCFGAPLAPPSSRVDASPCGCRRPGAATALAFVDGTWCARCVSCGGTWRGAHRLGEHGRWESLRPRLRPARPTGGRAAAWFFDEPLEVTGVSSASVSFRAPSGMLAGVSVVLPDRAPLEGQLTPFELTSFPTGRRDLREAIVPDAATRARAVALIDAALRVRLDAGARGEDRLLRARADANLATRIRDLLV